MKVLFADGYNLIHRASYGYDQGDFSTVYTFFRSFRSLIQQIKPDKVIFVLEGHPKFRFDLYPEYKANRTGSSDDFRRQKDIIIDIMCRLPVEVIKHPDYEGDDLIGKLVTSVYNDDECVIVTGDTDFIQLLEYPNNFIFNPIKKEWVSKSKHNYVLAKSIIGDKSDNIIGLVGVGPKTTDKVLSGTQDEIDKWLDSKPGRRETVERNQKLIKFADVPLDGVINMSTETDFDWVREEFSKMEFKTMLKDEVWERFVNTFLMQ